MVPDCSGGSERVFFRTHGVKDVYGPPRVDRYRVSLILRVRMRPPLHVWRGGPHEYINGGVGVSRD
jgi:hypothetical protein